MPIDGCTHSFRKLTTTILPGYMKILRKRIKTPHRMTEFMAGRKAMVNRLHERGEIPQAKDFAGCYVLIENGVPLYVGISRHVAKRLRQHSMGKTHMNSSLSYKMAHRQLGVRGFTRKKAMEDAKFKAAFDLSKVRIGKLDVALIPIACPVELHLFEVYAALELKTAEWNSFRTH